MILLCHDRVAKSWNSKEMEDGIRVKMTLLLMCKRGGSKLGTPLKVWRRILTCEAAYSRSWGKQRGECSEKG